ncbi:quinone oxidoreductase [Mycena vulgaris]|nr:quinone oxidoreductase [Mycena vulgaris]
MRAVLIENEVGDASSLHIGDTTTPSPQPHEVLVKIKAFGLNRGRYPPPPGSSSYSWSAVGANVTQWKVGDEVLAYAEYLPVLESHLMRKPAHLSWAQAASIPENFLTAFQTLFLCTSGVGLAAIQLARFHGARTVTGTASNTEKLDMVLAMTNGATHVVNYRTADFSETIKQATEGKGVEVIIDLVGQSHWDKNISSLAVDGRMTLVGVVSGATVASVDLMPLIKKRLHIQGSSLRSQPAAYQADLISRFEKQFLHLITGDEGSGPIKTSIHKVYPWTEIQEAHREMEANNNSGKIIVEIV